MRSLVRVSEILASKNKLEEQIYLRNNFDRYSKIILDIAHHSPNYDSEMAKIYKRFG